MIPGRGGGGGAKGAPQPSVGAGAAGGCSVDQPGGGVVDPGVAQSELPPSGSGPIRDILSERRRTTRSNVTMDA